MPGPATPIYSAAVTADVDALVAADGALRLMGYTVRETASSPAVASGSIVNGATGAAVGKVVPFALLASDCKSVWFGPEGLACPLGISIDFIAGKFDIAIFYRMGDA